MIIVMKSDASTREVATVLKKVASRGFKPHLSKGSEATIIGVIGDERKLNGTSFSALPGVDRVIPVLCPFKLASRQVHPKNTVVRVNGLSIGDGSFTVMAGPCAVESSEQVMATARRVKKAGAVILRGGAFKPRTSPYSFQGLGRDGLEILAEARKQTGLSIVTEVITAEDVPLVSQFADILQVGARNMQNFSLLEACGRQPKPVLLKRGMMSTIEELLLSAEYILSRGNPNVILCERGIRTFEKYTRNTLDISAAPVVKRLSHLPIIVDPSHAVGVREYVAPLARAAIAAEADGLLIEVHPNPNQALCDGQESLTPDEFDDLMGDLKRIARAVGRRITRQSAGRGLNSRSPV